MESAAVLRSFHGVLHLVPHAQSFLEKPAFVPVSRAVSNKHLSSQVPFEGWRLISSTKCRKVSLLTHAKASDTTSALSSDAAASDKASQGLLQKKIVQNSTFPNGFETLILNVCDETDVAELKIKVGDFEMHLKRDVGTPNASAHISPPIVAPATTPPTPSKPTGAVAPPPLPQKSTSPFTNVSSSKKASKLAALEASSSSAYVIVSSPTVGSFRRQRTLKGKKQPPSCKEGDVIKEGQTIGFLDQFGSELPVKSDVAGEVLKVLYKDGEPVGYGDPLIAVLPSFHAIK